MRCLPLSAALALAGWALGGCSPTDASSGASEAGLPLDAPADSPVAEGLLAVQARRCARCHQSPVPADGVLSGQSSPVPGSQAYGSNLTPDPDTGMDAWDAGSIAQSILVGVIADGGTLCPAMPTYADAGMSSAEALAIAAYLQTLTPVWHLVPQSVCPGAGDGG